VRLERAQLGLLAAVAATIPVSIFAAETLLALVLVTSALLLVRGRLRLDRTPLDAPLFAFAVWTILSASFAADPLRAHEDSKKLLLFALFYIAVATLSPADPRERVLGGLFLGGLALALLMIVQFHVLGHQGLDERPQGFLGHWMSASGVAMGVMVAAAARIAFGPRPAVRVRDAWLPGAILLGVLGVAALESRGAGVLPRRLFVAALAASTFALAVSGRPGARRAIEPLAWAALPACAWAVLVSQTRNAWLGGLVGLAIVAGLRRPRLLWVPVAGAAFVLLLRPAVVTSRLTVNDASSLDRYYQWQAGIDMILDKPVFGQGPGMILTRYPRYRWPEAPNPTTPHLHNNALQIAAERGIPSLVFFGWWALVALVTALREARRARTGTPDAWPAAAALGVIVALLVAGLFEYNLGDSEVLMLGLLLTSLPFALLRERGAVAR